MVSATADLPEPYAEALSGPPPPGVKLACASCIRGHRTSSCIHTDGSKGPLYPIRSKGRPPTQCDHCRRKRKESGRHSRCDCLAKVKKQADDVAADVPSASSQSISKKRKAEVPLGAIGDDSRRPQKPDVHRSHGSSGSIRIEGESPLTELPPLARSSSLDHGGFTWPTIPSMATIPDLAAERTNRLLRQDEPPFRPLEIPQRSSRQTSSLSLSSLMNPCSCSTSGYCTCCRDSSKGAADGRKKSLDESGIPPCCRDSECCASSSASTKCGSRTDTGGSQASDQGCCSNASKPAASASSASRASSPMSPRTPRCVSSAELTAQSPSAPSIELLLQAVDMTSEFVAPTCGCGDSCRCPSCLSKQPKQVPSRGSQSADACGDGLSASTISEPDPPATAADADCDSCMACDLGLSKPSGINVVDQWIEQGKHQQTGAEHDLTEASTPPAQPASTPPVALPQTVPSVPSGVPTLHGGLLSSVSQPTPSGAPTSTAEVRAELVLVHPDCLVCLDVVRRKGVGILTPAPPPGAVAA